ncbi:hypothetical protein ABIB40_003669 [Pedobacter sp. UYP30]|uniref:hypothetical protein n=1 Tax=Pedobacter sp. UYP30 TaxID=1756400 RepID=UPI00339B882C
MKLIGIVFMISLLACSTKSPKYIQGYIYNELKKPMIGIKVEDPNDRNIFSITDMKGYFKINQMINGRYLYVILKEKMDSIYIVRTHPETGRSYSFVEGRKDTVFIDEKTQKIIGQ